MSGPKWYLNMCKYGHADFLNVQRYGGVSLCHLQKRLQLRRAQGISEGSDPQFHQRNAQQKCSQPRSYRISQVQDSHTALARLHEVRCDGERRIL